MSKKTLVICLVFAVFALAGSVWLHYELPRIAVVKMTGVDSKRAESIITRSVNTTEKAPDVFFFFVEHENKQAAVYRNEDTGWGWPPYFKFNAADLQAKAQGLIGQKVRIKYYGWRNKLWGLFPNVLDVEEAGSDPAMYSKTRIFFFSLWGVLLVLLFPRY